MSRASRFQKLVFSASGDMEAGEVGFVPAEEALQILDVALGVNFGANCETWMNWYEAQPDKDAVERRCIEAWKKTWANDPPSSLSPEEIQKLMRDEVNEADRNSRKRRPRG